MSPEQKSAMVSVVALGAAIAIKNDYDKREERQRRAVNSGNTYSPGLYPGNTSPPIMAKNEASIQVAEQKMRELDADVRRNEIARKGAKANHCLITTEKNGLRGSLIENTCEYTVSVTFCVNTLIGEKSVVFECSSQKFGAETVNPRGSTHVMGLGNPDPGITFILNTASCKAPFMPSSVNYRNSFLSYECD